MTRWDDGGDPSAAVDCPEDQIAAASRGRSSAVAGADRGDEHAGRGHEHAAPGDEQAVPGTGAGDVGAPPTSDALPGPLVPRAARAPRAVFDALSAPREGALGAGAQVVGVARAVADATAPRRGRCTVRIDIGADGNVTRVSSTSASWEAFTQGLQAKLAGRRLRLQPGARGALVRLAVSADVTSVPPILTGEARATPCRPLQRDPAGGADVAANIACVDPTALLPIPRHRVSVSLAGEQAL